MWPFQSHYNCVPTIVYFDNDLCGQQSDLASFSLKYGDKYYGSYLCFQNSFKNKTELTFTLMITPPTPSQTWPVSIRKGSANVMAVVMGLHWSPFYEGKMRSDCRGRVWCGGPAATHTQRWRESRGGRQWWMSGVVPKPIRGSAGSQGEGRHSCIIHNYSNNPQTSECCGLGECSCLCVTVI